jgi:hypothetical protein
MRGQRDDEDRKACPAESRARKKHLNFKDHTERIGKQQMLLKTHLVI